MNYDRAAILYVKMRREIDELEAKITAIKAKKVELENWFALKAAEDGLKTIPTPHGTAYWSTHYSATVAAREPFFEFVKEHNMYDLLQARASSTAVRSYIEGHGEAPPGINFSSTKVFNLREGKVNKDD